MRKIQYIALVLLAALFAGCINDHIENTLCRDGVLTLNLSTSAPSTRLDTPDNGKGEGTNDDEPNTESLIKDIQYFLYPYNSAENVNAVAAGLITLDGDDMTTQEVTIDAGTLTALCPAPGDKCDIYVIVNYIANGGTSLVGNDDTKRATLKNTPIESSFDMGVESFVMDSEVFEVTRGIGDNSNKLTSETIYVSRAASKILIEVKVQTAIDVSGTKWIPITEYTNGPATQNMMLSFYNGVTEGVIDDNSDTDPDGKDIRATSDNPYYLLEDILMVSKGYSGEGKVQGEGDTTITPGETEGEFHHFVPMAPLYSYTSLWDDDDADAPTFKLSIPWFKNDGVNTAWVNYDYTVPVSLKDNQLVRNKAYYIKLTVGALGDLNYLDPSVYSYVVLDWESVSMDAELSRPSYLVVEKNYVEMKNVNSASVGYQSSDAVTAYITGFKCSFYENVNGKATKREYNYTYPVSDKKTSLSDVAPRLTNLNFSIALDGQQVTLNHTLDNVMDDKIYHYFPYEVTVRVTNTVTGMYEDITFVQYPAMYVEYETMTSSTVFVNGNSSRSSGWWWVRGSASNSKNIYKFSVSAFDASTRDYIIADPREPANSDNFVFRENIDATSAVRTTATDASGDNTLTGYRATITGPASEHLVAPAFLVASSYISNGENRINEYSYETNGKYRCAGYQENGYPAGRWRLPTPAEILVVARMCTEKKLENVFYAGGSAYLSSNGAYKVYETDGGTVEYDALNSATLRCVYDIWYWKDKCTDVSQFIWGADGDDLAAKHAAGYLEYIR